MRAVLLVAILLHGCGSSSSPAAPRVEDEAALAVANTRRPARTITIDAKGRVSGLPAPPKPAAQDDDPPPPPEDEEEEELGPDASITEDIMGKAESEADIARRERAALRRATGVIGRRDDVVQRAPQGWPNRVTTVTGELLPDRTIERDAAYVVLAHPAAPATALVDAVHATEAAIGVLHRGQVRLLPLSFVAESQRSLNDTPALEVRVRGDALEVEAIPSVPTVVPWPAKGGDAEAVKSAVAAARARRNVDPRIAIDVLVDQGITVQRLVDVIVVLEGTGTHAIALGRIPPPGSQELERRGHRITYMRQGPSWPAGPLTIDTVRAPFKAQHAALEACNVPSPSKRSYDELVVVARFTITPAGTVENPKVSAMTVKKHGRIEEVVSNDHPNVVACVTPIVAAMTFPAAATATEVELPFGLYD